jgi:hypothetical protein
MRTLEHLKGFIIDSGLVASSEDFAKAIGGAQVWLTPTLYAVFEGRRVADAKNLLERPEMRYVSLRRRERWKAFDPNEAAHWAKTEALVEVAVPIVMQRLLPLHPHWLAGTDSANYPLQVPGYALLDELVEMERAGIPRADVIRAATTEAAEALHASSSVGKIAAGMRADFIALEADPTQDLRAFGANRGVMVRGRWLSRASIDAALSRLASIEAEPDSTFKLDRRGAQSLVAQLEKLSLRHIALEATRLRSFAEALESAGWHAEAARAGAIVARNETGPCEALTP